MLPSLSLLPLDSLAKTSGFVRRRPRKLSLEAFLQSILLALYQPSHSLQSWAAQLSALQSELFSKQALHRRCGKGLVNFLELLLATVLGNLMRRDLPTELFQHFGSPTSERGLSLADATRAKSQIYEGINRPFKLSLS